MTITQGAHISLTEILSFSFLFLLVKSFEEEIQLCDDHVDTTKG